MKIKIHEQNLTKLSHRLGAKPEDCAAWVEELILDIEESCEDSMSETLGENFSDEQVKNLASNLIEHFRMEDEVDVLSLYPLIYNLVTV